MPVHHPRGIKGSRMQLISVHAHCRNKSATVPSLSIAIVRFCRIPQTGSEDACATVSVSNEMSAFRSPTACGTSRSSSSTFPRALPQAHDRSMRFPVVVIGQNASIHCSDSLKPQVVHNCRKSPVSSHACPVAQSGGAFSLLLPRRSCHQGIPSARRSPAIAIHKVDFSDASMPLFSLSHFSHNLAHSTQVQFAKNLI